MESGAHMLKKFEFFNSTPGCRQVRAIQKYHFFSLDHPLFNNSVFCQIMKRIMLLGQECISAECFTYIYRLSIFCQIK